MKNKLLLALSFIMLGIFTFKNTNAQFVNPENIGDKYVFNVGNIRFEINPEVGARFSSLKVDGNEIMHIATSGNWGSTFWPSPQSVWGWPPSNQLDINEYTGGIFGQKVWLTGQTDPQTDLSFSKTVYADLMDTSINIEYVMINQKNEEQTYAPWEVTRVLPNGLAFFPAGDNAVFGDMAGSTETIDSYVWYDNSESSGDKFFSDSKGWLAHAGTDGYLFIKTFEDISVDEAAPEEAEVEVYDGGSYVELEDQGAYKSIAANDSVAWTVKWKVRKIPSNIEVSKGSQALIDYTESIINEESTGISSKTVNKELAIYPNPAENYIFTMDNQFNGQAYSVYNISGQLINQGFVMNNMVNVEALNKGYYIIKINNQSEQYTSSFIKK